MKIWPFLLPGFLVTGLPVAAQNGNTNSTDNTRVVVQRGSDTRVWAKVTTSTDPAGNIVAVTNAGGYCEVADGLCYQDPDTGAWLDSVAQITPTNDGAFANQTQFSVRWMGNANAAGGALFVTLPPVPGQARQTIASQPCALAFLDKSTGTSVLFSSLQDSQGQLTADGVTYTNSFAGSAADIEYKYSIDSIEQNIILTERPPDPATVYGLNPATTVIQVWTRILSGPNPQITQAVESGAAFDSFLSFGKMVIGDGSAFYLPGQGQNQDLGKVKKHWVQVNGSTFLVEELEWSKIANVVQALPQHASITLPGKSVTESLASANPADLQKETKGTKRRESKPMMMARETLKRPGVLIDYALVTSISDMTFQSDTTYYVSGTCVLSGSQTVFEGGTILKYTNGASVVVGTPVIWTGSPYMPVWMVAKDQDDYGDIIAGSTGSPGTAYYANFALFFNGYAASTNLALQYLRVMNAQTAVVLDGWSNHVISDVQMVNCGTGVSGSYTTFSLWNGLMVNVGIDFGGGSSTGDIEHLTVDTATAFNGGLTLGVTNSLLVGVSGLGAIAGSNSIYSASSGTGIFQTVGGGSHYLVQSNPNVIAAGTANINPSLATALAQMTTEAPILLTNNFTNNTTLSPAAQLDTGTPDLGYHYSVLDYVCHDLTVSSGVTLTLTNGVALGLMDTTGITVNGSISSQGLPNLLNQITPVMAVQEAPTTSEYYFLLIGGNGSWQNLSFRFTDLPNPGGGQAAQLWLLDSWTSLPALSAGPITLRDSQMPAGRIFLDLGNNNNTNYNSFEMLNITNNWMERGNIYFWRSPYRNGADYVPCGMVINCYNNLFHNGFMTVTYNMASYEWAMPGLMWPLHDTVFQIQTSSFSVTGSDHAGGAIWTNMIVPGWNAYNAYNPLYISYTNWPQPGPSNVSFAVADFQTGTLGNYYYPTNGTNLARLLKAGSTSAANLGFYHYTITPDNAILGSNTVSIGRLYIATDAYGNPLDTTGDGQPDYIKDSNGDGVFDSGDLVDWQNPFTIYDQGTTLGSYFTSHLRLGYWKFDTVNLTNQAGTFPYSTNQVSITSSWDGNAVSLTNLTSDVEYYVVDTNGFTNFNCQNGTIRFWFKPCWSSTNPPGQAVFLDIGNNVSSWVFTEQVIGTNCLLTLASASNGYWEDAYFRAPIVFQSNLWYQIALTYSPTNVALYTNGALLDTSYDYWPAYFGPEGTVTTSPLDWTTGDGVVYYPSGAFLAGNNWFSLGNNSYTVGVGGGGVPANGQLDEVETFNYPLTPEAIAAGYPSFAGNSTNMLDTYYVGRSDMLQRYVDGVFPPVSGTATPCRLGYWRFDTPLLYGEQGQTPLSQNGVTLSNNWSGTAVNVGSASTSQLTYRDVYTNGWANINCRQGAVRFWLKPNWSSGSGPSGAPLLFLGNTGGISKWSLEADSSGNTISFITESNSVSETYIAASCHLTYSNWTQIVLNYGPNGASLYTNGVLLASTNIIVTNWPDATDRALGMVIGNNTAHTASINGQFDELETFNYPLSTNEIWQNFQAVAAIDSDLDGIPDVLEDHLLSQSRPFLGAPIVVAGTIEAEQFDLGGAGIAYSNTYINPTNAYRSCGMFITNCDDLGGGYCLDLTLAGDWAQYTVNVLVPGTYMVEVRASADAGATGGVFQCDFTNGFGVISGGGFSNSTGPLTITTTGWTNYSAVVFLTNGINTMRLHFLTNVSFPYDYVGRFNYISIYPWWQAGFNTNLYSTFTVSGLLTNGDYVTASNNAVYIQNAVNSAVTAGGGTVLITNKGTYQLAQASPNETLGYYDNSAVSILGNNIEICGAGKTNTILMGYNRATTVLSLGLNSSTNLAQSTNFILRDLTVEGQPHRAINATNATATFYDYGRLSPAVGSSIGSPIVFLGVNGSQYAYNILLTNCQFLYSDTMITVGIFVSNVMVRNCSFVAWGGTDSFGDLNVYATNFGTGPNDGAHQANVGLFAPWGGQGPQNNCVLLENSYNGNSLLTNSGIANTNNVQIIAPDGFVWLQAGGNDFVGRNSITNYAAEGIQFNTGPNGAAGNTLYSRVSDGSACALCAFGCSAQGLTGTGADYSTTFIGNWIYGGRRGDKGTDASAPSVITFSGNYLSLFPAWNEYGDSPGGAVALMFCQAANICGNTLAAGGLGLEYYSGCSNALVLMNDFGAATYVGVGYDSFSELVPDFSLQNACILRNILGKGTTFHLQVPYANSASWFLNGNTYVNGASNIPVFLDPLASSVHISN